MTNLTHSRLQKIAAILKANLFMYLEGHNNTISACVSDVSIGSGNCMGLDTDYPLMWLPIVWINDDPFHWCNQASPNANGLTDWFCETYVSCSIGDTKWGWWDATEIEFNKTQVMLSYWSLILMIFQIRNFQANFSYWWLGYLVKLPQGECDWTLLMISQHWFRWWLGAVTQQVITWAHLDPDLCHYMASLGYSGLKYYLVHSSTLNDHMMQLPNKCVIPLEENRLQQWIYNIESVSSSYAKGFAWMMNYSRNARGYGAISQHSKKVPIVQGIRHDTRSFS